MIGDVLPVAMFVVNIAIIHFGSKLNCVIWFALNYDYEDFPFSSSSRQNLTKCEENVKIYSKILPKSRKMDLWKPKSRKVTIPAKMAKNWIWGPAKSVSPNLSRYRLFAKRTDPNWSFLSSEAPFTIYTRVWLL